MQFITLSIYVFIIVIKRIIMRLLLSLYLQVQALMRTKMMAMIHLFRVNIVLLSRLAMVFDCTRSRAYPMHFHR